MSERAAPRKSETVTPKYPDKRTRALSERLEEARARKKRLAEAGAITEEADREILDLRRRIREGGQLRAGDSLGDGRYLLVEQVGRGGFAIVWKAVDRERHNIVAVKVLHPNLAGDPLRLERFLRGVRLMSELRHDAVVRVLEPYGEDGGYHYFVMEFVGGGDLRKAVLEKRLSTEQTIRVVMRVSEALTEAHTKGIVHRDLKPANILIDEQGVPKLTDFDLASAVDTTGGTRTGAIGTFLYAAPELLSKPQDSDATADVFSLGMTVVFGLYGNDLPENILRTPDQIISTLPCNYAIKKAIRRAIDWDKNVRFSDAAEFRHAVLEAINKKPFELFLAEVFDLTLQTSPLLSVMFDACIKLARFSTKHLHIPSKSHAYPKKEIRARLQSQQRTIRISAEALQIVFMLFIFVAVSGMIAISMKELNLKPN